MKRFPLTLLYIALGTVVAAALGFKIFQPVQVLPRIRLAPGYAMVDQSGERLTNESLRGQFVLYSFLYTRCDSPECERINTTMRAVQNQLDSMDLDDIGLSLVTISFDPAHDTTEVLAAYAEEVGADPDLWHFATHDDQTTLKNIIGGGFEVYYNERDAGDGYTFDTAFVLVDGWGIIRGEYHYQTLAADEERIIRHIGVLADEVRNSKGAATAAYEAAHLFLCYAD